MQLEVENPENLVLSKNNNHLDTVLNIESIKTEVGDSNINENTDKQEKSVFANNKMIFDSAFQKDRSLLREETKMDVEIDKQENLVLSGVTNNFDCKNVKLECDEIEKQENSFDYSTKSQFNSAIQTEYIGKSLS